MWPFRKWNTSCFGTNNTPFYSFRRAPPCLMVNWDVVFGTKNRNEPAKDHVREPHPNVESPMAQSQLAMVSFSGRHLALVGLLLSCLLASLIRQTSCSYEPMYGNQSRVSFNGMSRPYGSHRSRTRHSNSSVTRRVSRGFSSCINRRVWYR